MLRHLLSILLLPFLVVVGVPIWLLTAFAATDSRWGDGSLIVWLSRSIGVVVIILGLALFSWCVSLFARVGQGTLAPWDPTRNLVAIGPYRFVRNPMISGIALMLLGQALLWGSWAVGIWLCVFMCFNHIYFVLVEEPGLEDKHLARSVIRQKPWPSNPSGSLARWSPQSRSNTLPGFKIPFGSSARFSRRITSISAAVRDSDRKGFFSRPMPCSAEIDPASRINGR